jgi:hypothetical protein
MSPLDLNSPLRHWTAAELRRLPADQRDAIVGSAAAAAAAEYETDPALTDFSASRDDDPHGECSNSVTEPQ